MSTGALPQYGWVWSFTWAGRVEWSDQEKDMQSEFQRTFNRLLAQSGKSITQVARLGMVDRSYLMRLQDGEKLSPSLETLMRIWIGLAMDERIVNTHPDFEAGLSSLVYSAAMSDAPLKLAVGKLEKQRKPTLRKLDGD